MYSFKLKSLRKSNSMTQSDICIALDVKQGTVSKWETGKCLPDITTAFKIAKILNCTIDELFIKEN